MSCVQANTRSHMSGAQGNNNIHLPNRSISRVVHRAQQVESELTCDGQVRQSAASEECTMTRGRMRAQIARVYTGALLPAPAQSHWRFTAPHLAYRHAGSICAVCHKTHERMNVWSCGHMNKQTHVVAQGPKVKQTNTEPDLERLLTGSMATSTDVSCPMDVWSWQIE